MHDLFRCSVDVFLNNYAPYEPSTELIDEIYAVVRDKCLAQTQAPDGSQKMEWAAFAGGTSCSDETRGEEVILGLQHILRVIKDTEPAHTVGRRLHFCYKNSHNHKNRSDFGALLDGCIQARDVTSDAITPAETAVVVKRSSAPSENRKQLVTAASHIMHDDPRRMFTYGITIENRAMPLWYFDRSRSVKSDPFDFTQDLKTFVRVFVSFLWATEREMGFDPTVHRVKIGKEIRYVYQVDQRFFLTQSAIHSPRLLPISGKATRVSEVVEVAGLSSSQLQTRMNDGKKYALKDAWLDENAPTERTIFEEVLSRLERNPLPDRQSLPESPLWEVLEEALKNEKYKKYFMEIVCDQQGDRNKPVPEDTFRSGTIAPNHNILDTGTRNPISADVPKDARSYKVKRQYRLVYADVGQPLDLAPNLDALFQVIHDAFIALALMMLANWVHRDVSTGNIILIEIEPGRYVGKLSDLEYAKGFNSRPVGGSNSPQIGTPEFMPVEVHSKRAIYPRSAMKPPEKPPQGKSTLVLPEGDATWPPFYRFDYDLESVFWIIVWSLLILIPYDLGQEFAQEAFTYELTPSQPKMQLFLHKGLRDFHNNLAPSVFNLLPSIQWMHITLFNAYKDTLEHRNDYMEIHGQIWKYIVEMRTEAEELNDKVKLTDRASKTPSNLQTGGKRQREDGNNDEDVGADDTVRQDENEAGPSRKRPRHDDNTIQLQDPGAFSYRVHSRS